MAWRLFERSTAKPTREIQTGSVRLIERLCRLNSAMPCSPAPARWHHPASASVCRRQSVRESAASCRGAGRGEREKCRDTDHWGDRGAWVVKASGFIAGCRALVILTKSGRAENKISKEVAASTPDKALSPTIRIFPIPFGPTNDTMVRRSAPGCAIPE